MSIVDTAAALCPLALSALTVDSGRYSHPTVLQKHYKTSAGSIVEEMMKRLLAGMVVFLSLVPSLALAQTTNATLGGTVGDASGARIPGVSVTAANTQTGIVTTVVTNETGAYRFASVQTGIYKVTAELPGFQTQAYNEVTLGVGQQVRLNFRLQVGTQTQSVEVNVAADTLIATTSSSVGAVLPEYKLRDLPLASRNALDLVATTAGTQGGAFAGPRSVAVNTVRDGVPVSDGRSDVGVSASTYVSPDLVDEVRVIVAPADAELGRGSGQVQMATRSGTNQFRGSLFWQNRRIRSDVEIAAICQLSAESLSGRIANDGCDLRLTGQNGNIEILKRP
jgi:hypothetical protein